jgi:phosphatidylglycerol:prolipoprotein diacylglycerol transferase
MTLSYLIWNGSPEIFSIGFITLRWYGFLFAGGFVLSYIILTYMFRKERKLTTDVDTLTVYMVIATVLGARLGHVIFYQPEIFTRDPLGVLLPFQFNPTFKFTGFMGLASHGAAIGILFALWLYSNYLIIYSGKPGSELQFGDEGNEKVKHKIKKGFNIIKRVKPGQSYIQILDRIVILVMLAGAMIRLGNFFNSEIIGKPTDSNIGIVFSAGLTERFTSNEGSPVDYVKVMKNTERPDAPNGRKPLNIYVFFKEGTTRERADFYLVQEGKYYLSNDREFFDEPATKSLSYLVVEDKPGQFVGKIQTLGIARHPAQLYESLTCFIFFLVLFWLWKRGKVESQPGLIFGIFMVVLWTLRFLYEYLKEPQVDFENSLPIYMGQILSIPLVLVGIFILVRAVQGKFKKA